MKLLHLADVHLGATYAAFGELAPSRAAEVLEAFRRLPDVAAEERVDAVLIAGDLFDRPQPGREAMAAARETIRRLVELCLPVFMVPGNHDAMTLRLDPYRELARAARVRIHGVDSAEPREWPLEDEAGRKLAEKHTAYILASPRFGPPATVETADGPLHVYGFAFDSVECREPVQTFRRHPGDGVHVALLHASVRDAAHWQGSASSLSTTTEALAALDVDYLALGDHHRPRSPATFRGAPACYPGSFAATDLTEDGPRGYAIVELQAGAEPVVEYRESGVPPVEHLELDVSSLTDHVQVAELAMQRLPDGTVPLVRLVGEPSFPLDGESVAAELRERYGHAEVRDETRFYAASRLDELSATDTVAGHVVRLGRERIEAASEGEERQVAQQALRAALRALEVD